MYVHYLRYVRYVRMETRHEWYMYYYALPLLIVLTVLIVLFCVNCINCIIIINCTNCIISWGDPTPSYTTILHTSRIDVPNVDWTSSCVAAMAQFVGSRWWTTSGVYGRLEQRLAHHNVVMAENINIFKNRLDKFWSSYDFVYLFRAQPLDTGSVK